MLVGHSAGGQLALWAAKRAHLPVVALAPVSDVRESAARTGPDGAPARFMPEEHFAEGSPIELLPLGVPQIVIHGTEDDGVPYAMSERYVAAAGNEAELVTLEGSGHFELIDPLAPSHTNAATRVVYGLVGLSAVYAAALCRRSCAVGAAAASPRAVAHSELTTRRSNRMTKLRLTTAALVTAVSALSLYTPSATQHSILLQEEPRSDIRLRHSVQDSLLLSSSNLFSLRLFSGNSRYTFFAPTDAAFA